MSREALWNGPIVDAHQHFWDPTGNNHPWLQPGVLIPFRYGDYSAIKRRYLPEDYLADTSDHAVCETVYVETEWDPAMPVQLRPDPRTQGVMVRGEIALSRGPLTSIEADLYAGKRFS